MDQFTVPYSAWGYNFANKGLFAVHGARINSTTGDSVMQRSGNNTVWQWAVAALFRTAAMAVLALAALLAISSISAAWAAPTVVGSSVFTPADSARNPNSIPNDGDEYLDSGGVWNGLAEVTNTTGDSLQFVLTNSAAGTPNPLLNDIAYDLSLTLDVPSGFRLPSSPFTVTTSATGGDPTANNCVPPGGGSITANPSRSRRADRLQFSRQIPICQPVVPGQTANTRSSSV